jgi:hypothetical protein
VDGIEFLGVSLLPLGAALGNDTEARTLNLRVDGTREIAAGCVGLDNGESALNGHRKFLCFELNRFAFYAACGEVARLCGWG